MKKINNVSIKEEGSPRSRRRGSGFPTEKSVLGRG